jgi:hypothetical protein
MNNAKFRLELAAVTALVIIAGWPQLRPFTEVTVWASRANAPRPELVTRDARVRAAQANLAGRANRTTRSTVGPRAIDEPSDLTSAGARLNAIVGRARTLTNQPVPYGRMVLRNIRSGLVEARTTADEEGRFSFIDAPQSGYLIELVGADGTVIASSDLIGLNNGDFRRTVIRVAANSTVRAIFGSKAAMPTVQDAVNRAVEGAAREVSESTKCTSPPCA